MSVAIEELYQENEKLKALCREAITYLRNASYDGCADIITKKLNKI